ncbi:MAG: serine hydrolase domain-containing protein, partial [Stenotrophomonas sp.]
MKDKSKRRHIRPVASGLLGVLMPFALSSTAQTPTQASLPMAQAAAALPVNLENAPQQSPTQPMPYRVALRPDQVQPLPADFNVAAIESLAEQLTYGNRVPGMAMAIVQNGRVLSARGYGVTDISNPQQVDAHTVFRLASLSKAFAGTMAGLLVNDGTLRWDSKVT